MNNSLILINIKNALGGDLKGPTITIKDDKYYARASVFGREKICSHNDVIMLIDNLTAKLLEEIKSEVKINRGEAQQLEDRASGKREYSDGLMSLYNLHKMK